jgi:5'-3' exonuclease
MGGKKVYAMYQDCIRRRHCSDYREAMAVIDIIYQLFRIMIGIKNKKRSKDKKIHDYIDINLVNPGNTKSLPELIAYEDSVAHLIAICSFVELLIEKLIYGIFVFDGKAPKLKKKKLEERKHNRKRATEELSKIEDATSVDYIKQHKRCVELRDIHYKETMELLKAMGLITVQSPGEADSQCAAIASSLPNVNGIIAEDSDILIFGGPKIIKNFNRKNSMVNEIKLADILETLKNRANKIRKNNSLPELTEFSHEHFVDLCILQGTDYNEPIRDIDPNELYEIFVLNNFEVLKLLKYLVDQDRAELIPIHFTEKGEKVSFDKKWLEVRDYYLETEVINPEEIDLTINYPNFVKMVEILHKKNNFNIKVVRKLYDGLVNMYNRYYNLETESNPYRSFSSYQAKFHTAKLKKHMETHIMKKSCSKDIHSSESDKKMSNKFDVLAC